MSPCFSMKKASRKCSLEAFIEAIGGAGGELKETPEAL
jgi:hypothetical protein